MVILDQFRRTTRRLEGRDYSDVGRYFITICTKNREHLLGEIHNGTMKLNEVGKIIEEEIRNTPLIRPDIQINAFVIMPNHVHAIVVIMRRSADCRGVKLHAPTNARAKTLHHPSRTLGSIVRGMKSAVTKRIRCLPEGFDGNLWQRNYHDRIIRTQSEWGAYKKYIEENPQNWNKDDDNIEPHGMLPL